MGRIAVIGEEVRVRPFGLAGALVAPADDADGVRSAWNALPADVEVLLLTPAAAAALADERAVPRDGILTVTLP